MPSLRRAGAGQWTVAALFAAVQSVRLMVLSRLPDGELVRHIPDDAFYYMVMGRNFARLGRWTFDGVEPASGFHLLWGYLLAGLYRVDPTVTLHGVFIATGLITICCVTVAACLVQRTAAQVFGDGVEAGVAIIFLSTISLQMTLCVMETPLVLLASAAVLDMLCRTDETITRHRLIAGFALGMAGTLARSDFGLLPLCLFAMQLALFLRGFANPRRVKLATSILGGATLGLSVVAVHTHWVSGGWVQASANQKLFWAGLDGFSIMPTLGLLLHFAEIGVFTGNVSLRTDQLIERGGWLLLVLLALGLVLTLWRLAASQRIIACGIACTIIAFLSFYRFDSAAIQGWYIGNFEGPIAVLAGGATSWFARRSRWATAGVATIACCCGIWISFVTPLPGQIELYKVAISLRARPDLRPLGAWNTGILSYFAGGQVVNLDGLVNDRILPYTEAGTLLQYIQQRRLNAIADYPFMFSEIAKRHGGYADGKLERCLLKTDVSVPLVFVYTIKPECQLP